MGRNPSILEESRVKIQSFPYGISQLVLAKV
jgi:hypothetical protein